MQYDCDLKERTKRFAIRIIHLASEMPRTIQGRVVAKQLVRCATSVGANYRAARRARSKAEFIAKLQIALEECDESVYWLELLNEMGGAGQANSVEALKEGNELTAIFVSSLKTARNQNR